MENNQEEQTIDLRSLFLLLWRNILLIAGITVVITVLVGTYTVFGIDKQFESETTLRVTPAQTGDSINYNDVITSQKLVKTYSIIAKSRKVLSVVIEDLNLDYSYNQLKDSLTVTSIQDTDVISIKVTLTDADLAAKVANRVAIVFMGEIKNQVKIDTLSLIDTAVVNNNPVKPNVMLNVIIGFILGAMLSVGLVFLREFLNRTIKTEEDVEHYLKLPVIGAIPNLDKKYVN